MSHKTVSQHSIYSSLRSSRFRPRLGISYMLERLSAIDRKKKGGYKMKPMSFSPPQIALPIYSGGKAVSVFGYLAGQGEITILDTQLLK